MFLIINKPKGITSHDAVDQLRKITGVKKIGHAGTLDPNATGVLVVGVGRESTKKLGEIAKDTTKVYEAEIILGEERDTDDVLGKTQKSNFNSLPAQAGQNDRSKPKITKKNVSRILADFVGKQMQTPPAYSAIKVNGKKAYELARQGINVRLKPREIEIYSIDLNDFNYPKLVIEVEVSSGTYIRSLAKDIGKQLGTGAYLNNLARIRVGKFNIKDSVRLDNLTSDNWQNFAL